MRSFLLWCASMVVGSATILAAVVVLEGGTAALGSAAVLWLFALVVGVLLSAPYVLAPPNSSFGWSVSLPVGLWLVLLVIRLISGTGTLVLRVVWFLIALAIRRPVNQPTGKTASVPPSGQAAPAGPVPGSPVASTHRYPPPVSLTGSLAAPPASWQSDPTGRFQQRYWDGRSWTANVANGSVFAVDPI